MTKKNERLKKGFTLVEMLVALTIFSIVALSVSSIFRSGVRTWRAGNEWSEENQTFRTFFQTITKELQNSVNYSPEMPFEGTGREISFLTLEDRHDFKRGTALALVRVIYRYDAKKKKVDRMVSGQEQGFEARNAKLEGSMENIPSFEAAYAYKPIYENGPVRWKDEWRDEKTIPGGVRIKIGDFHTAVCIPAGILGDEDAFR